MGNRVANAGSFKKGHKKVGGRKVGLPNRETRRKLQVLADAAMAMVLTAEQIAMLSPIDSMRLIMFKYMQQEDWPRALQAAEAVAPYLHPKLLQTDTRVQHVLAGKTDLEIAADIESLRAKIAQAKTLPAPPVIEADSVYTEPEPAESPTTVTSYKRVLT